jgi:S-adenosylmethionine-diacylgycerolhomoserine-N-methlytransferase
MLRSENDAAARMDGIYRHQRFIYDLTRRYYLLGRDRLLAELAPPPGGTVLEIGCGTGRNLLRAAQLYPSVQCFGLDVSSAMLETAGANLARAGRGERIVLAAGDARAFNPAVLFKVASIDRIFLSYVLSMVPGWPDVVEGAIRHLSPSGSLHIVDFGDFARLPHPVATAMRAWLKSFHVTPIPQFERQLDTIATANRLDSSFESPYRGYTAYAALSRRATPKAVAAAQSQFPIERHAAVMAQ